MKLKVPELKRFFGSSATIKSKGIIPIYDYIKISSEGGKSSITKTNGSTYVVMDIAPVNETLLIDEKILSAIVKVTTADTIDVTVKNKKVLLSDGLNNMSFVLSSEEAYPEFPDSEKEGEVILTQDVLEAIGIAAKNLAVGDVIPAFNCVNLAYGNVVGGDHVRMYVRKADKLPTTLIEPLAANIISQFGEVKYYERGNYSFYQVGSFLFGFAKVEGAPVDYTRFLADVANVDYMEVSCQEIYNFIDLFMASSGSDSVPIDFDGEKLSFYDTDREVSNEILLSVEGAYKPKISLLPRLLNSLLKSIGKEKIRLSPLKTAPGITLWDENEPEAFGILGLISK